MTPVETNSDVIDDSGLKRLGFDPHRLARIRTALDADIESGRCDGAEMIVARAGSKVVHERRGYAQRATRQLLDESAVFCSMSIGKQFTNALVLHYVEQGALRLHQPVADVLPGFAARGKDKINLFHVLTHTSGLPSAIPPLPPEDLINIDKLAAYCAAAAPECRAGEAIRYSVIAAHAVLAKVLLQVAGRGRGFAQMMREELFDPLRMSDTSLGPRADLLERLCPMTACYDEPGMFDPAAAVGFEQLMRIDGAEIPGAGFLTTATDVHRFTEMLRNGGALEDARILSPAMIDFAARNWTGTLRTSLFDYSLDYRNWQPWPGNIGLGFFVRGEGIAPGPFGVMNSAGAFGGIGAGSTCFWIDPKYDLSFTFLSTGLMEDASHLERLGRLSDLVISAISGPVRAD